MMTTKFFMLAVAFSTATLFSCQGQKGKPVSLKNTADSVSYGIGISIGTNMKKDNLDSLNLDIMMQGIKSAMHGDSLLMDQHQAQAVIQSYLGNKQALAGKATLEEGRKFLEENGKKEGVITTASGLQYQVIREGTGPTPSINDTVKTHYHGTLINGTVFDSSVERGEPVEFPVGGVIKGWTEALQLMKVGSKYKLFIPSELAYGERAAGPEIKPNSTLIFEVELLEIKGK